MAFSFVPIHFICRYSIPETLCRVLPLWLFHRPNKHRQLCILIHDRIKKRPVQYNRLHLHHSALRQHFHHGSRSCLRPQLIHINMRLVNNPVNMNRLISALPIPEKSARSASNARGIPMPDRISDSSRLVSALNFGIPAETAVCSSSSIIRKKPSPLSWFK